MGASEEVVLRIKTVMDTSDIVSNINQVQNRLESLKMPKDLTSKTQTQFDELKRTVRDYQELLDKPHKTGTDLRKLDQLGQKMKTQFEGVEKIINKFDFKSLGFDDIKTPELEGLRREIDQVQNAGRNMVKNAFKGAGLTDGLGKAKGELKELESIANKMTARKGKRLLAIFEVFFNAKRIFR